MINRQYRIGSLIQVVETGETLEIVSFKTKGPGIAELRNVDGSDDEKPYWSKPWEGMTNLNTYIKEGKVKVLSY